MSEEKALRQAVLDNPEDDLPRLAYADWQEVLSASVRNCVAFRREGMSGRNCTSNQCSIQSGPLRWQGPIESLVFLRQDPACLPIPVVSSLQVFDLEYARSSDQGLPPWLLRRASST